MSIELILAHVTGLTDAVATINTRLDTINTQLTTYIDKAGVPATASAGAAVDLTPITDELTGIKAVVDGIADLVKAGSDDGIDLTHLATADDVSAVSAKVDTIIAELGVDKKSDAGDSAGKSA